MEIQPLLPMLRGERRIGVSSASQRLPASEKFTLLAALLPVGCGLLVLIGWAEGIEVLKRTYPTFVAMNPATAACLILSGIGIVARLLGFKWMCRCAGATIALAGMAKLVDLVSGGVPVDQIIFASLLEETREYQANRMAPNTAAAFCLVGAALSFASTNVRKLQLISQGLGAAVLLIAIFALVGHAFSIQHLKGVGPFIPMALHTGLALLAIGIAIITLSSEVGVMVVLRDAGPAGSMARTVLPLAIFIPMAVGAARLWGQEHGYYGTEAGVALQVIANLVVTSALLIPSILALYRSDGTRREREQALKRSEHLSRSINEASPDCISLLDADGIVLLSNEAAIRAYSLKSDEELVGRPWGGRLDEDARADRDAALAAAKEGGVGRVTLRLRDPKGSTRWFESLVSRIAHSEGQEVRFIVMSRDITEQKRVEHQVRWTATHDALTQLPNRALFQARLDELTTGRSNQGFSLLLLDIDDFKQVNDTLGHDAGDALLTTVAKRLQSTVRTNDFVARLGGDEFAIILEHADSEVATSSAAGKVLEGLKEPWLYDGRVGDCRVSIGASVFPQHGDTSSALLKNADIALYAAKVERGRLAIFDPEMRAKIQRRSSEISVAQHALQDNLIVPHYQPKVELATGRVIGFEALLRWCHPNQGVQLPGSIQSAFEDLELAQQLTDRILTSAVRDVRRWLDDGVEFGHVAVNAAAADFKKEDFAESLLQRLHSNRIPPSCFQIEVTETVFLGRGAEYVEKALKTLSENGIKIALDDFGTGYASLSHLKQFPVDIVKIDRSFLMDINEDTHNSAIIRTVISLGRSLGLDVIAEGVETAEQEQYLISQGCKYGQGFLYGKASPASHVPSLFQPSAKGASVAA